METGGDDCFQPASKPGTKSLEHLEQRVTPHSAPRFYLTSRQPLRPEVILLAIALAVGAVCAILFAVGHSGRRRYSNDSLQAARFADTAAGAASGASSDDDKDDPTQIDTIVLGDPSEAPVPGRRSNHVSPVHPTIVVRLPRTGDQTGLIPDGPAGRLLYAWLAAFNQANSQALREALPTFATGGAVAAQLQLRQQTGGFNLLSAKEVEPGVLVFRLRDQTTAGVEVLGTLQVAAGADRARIASFSLRAVPQVPQAFPDMAAPGLPGQVR